MMGEVQVMEIKAWMAIWPDLAGQNGLRLVCPIAHSSLTFRPSIPLSQSAMMLTICLVQYVVSLKVA